MTNLSLIPPNLCLPKFMAVGGQTKNAHFAGRSRRCVPGLSKPPCC